MLKIINMSRFIVIDGADGAGKATQVRLLVERLKSEGKVVETIDFPQYQNNNFGQLLRECLDGKRGDFMKIDPRIASTLYAADRFESASQIKQWLSEGKVVVADRFVSSNMLHQGAKLHDESERAEFLGWLDKIEHGVFGLPRPNLILYLDIPYEIRKGLMEGDTTRAHLDTYETNSEHQKAAEVSAQELVAGLNNWQAIFCVNDESKLKTREEIHELVYQAYSQNLS
jgi:dTMP kinase